MVDWVFARARDRYIASFVHEMAKSGLNRNRLFENNRCRDLQLRALFPWSSTGLINDEQIPLWDLALAKSPVSEQIGHYRGCTLSTIKRRLLFRSTISAECWSFRFLCKEGKCMARECIVYLGYYCLNCIVYREKPWLRYKKMGFGCNILKN